jgi:small conductance mechanosensitive channel
MDKALESAQTVIAVYGLRVLAAVAIFVIGRWVAQLIRKIIESSMVKAKAEDTLVSFVTHLAYTMMLTFVILAALHKLGVQTTSFIAILGAAGLAIGLALQGSLANFAAGVLMIIFKPCKAGDFIEGAGTAGIVEEIQIFTTQLRTPDNKTVIIPNSKLMGDNIVNYSKKDTRRVDLVVGVSYDADLKKTKEVILDELSKDERILNDPEPTVAVTDLADSSVNFVVRPWTETANYWDVYFATLENVKIRLDAEGISIPFPQRDVHLYQEQA